jgi:EpsI family protein
MEEIRGMKIGSRLGVTLALLTAGALILHTVPPVKGAVNPVSLYALPATLGSWSGVEGVPEEILPPDPSEKLSVRRTYRNGTRVAWISVALFGGQDDETRQASINRIYPQRNASLIEPVPFTLSLAGLPGRSVKLPMVVVHQESGRLLVAYWHQIGNRVYGNEYLFRLALMRDLIFARRADTLLVRIATPGDQESQVTDRLAVVADLAPAVYGALGQEIGK